MSSFDFLHIDAETGDVCVMESDGGLAHEMSIDGERVVHEIQASDWDDGAAESFVQGYERAYPRERD